MENKNYTAGKIDKYKRSVSSASYTKMEELSRSPGELEMAQDDHLGGVLSCVALGTLVFVGSSDNTYTTFIFG